MIGGSEGDRQIALDLQVKHKLPDQTQRSTSRGALVSKWGAWQVLSEPEVQTDPRLTPFREHGLAAPKKDFLMS